MPKNFSWTEKLRRKVFNGVEWREEVVIANQHPEAKVEGDALVFQVGTKKEEQGHVTLHADGSVNHHGAFQPHSEGPGWEPLNYATIYPENPMSQPEPTYSSNITSGCCPNCGKPRA